MSIDARFSIAIAIMAFMAYGCRVIGLIVGTHLRNRANLRRFLDILPACAMGAVLGPSLSAMTSVQAIAIVVSALVYFTSMRFLLALALGAAVLLSERWIMSMMA